MRGSRPEPDPARRERGIIPAHAGLTRVARCWPFGARDHPRACGAHSACCSPCIAGRGSSPRMRGSRYHFVSLPCWTGIIPAHAGLTHGDGICQEKVGDHPRACGAHSSFGVKSAANQGSSPRMRGSLAGFSQSRMYAGIIPAHAGLTY